MLEPMLASLMDAPLDDPQLVYEPKYDGIRAIAEIGPDGVKLWSRLGNEKTHQFPEIAQALGHVGASAEGARDARRRDRRARRQRQARRASSSSRAASTCRPAESRARNRIKRPDPSVAFIAFDVLNEGAHRLARPSADRTPQGARANSRARAAHPSSASATQVRGDGARALQSGAGGGLGRTHRQARRTRSTSPASERPTGAS